MTTPVYALVDLDDTLFQSRRKCPPDVPPKRLTVLATNEAGEPSAFATPRQMAFLAWLQAGAQLVPVTARSLAALRRVRLPFTRAICAHGGILLGADGEPDADWWAGIAAAAARVRPILATLEAAALVAAGEAEALRVQTAPEFETPLYVFARHAPDPDAEARLAALGHAVAPHVPPGWTVHANAGVLAWLPPFLGKAHAARRLIATLRAEAPDAALIGFGDSLTDGPFLALCDFAAAPRGSQLARSWWPCA